MIKKLIHIFLLILSLPVLAQQQKRINVPNVPYNPPPVPEFSWINACAGDSTCFINHTIRGYSYTWTVMGDSVNRKGQHIIDTLYSDINDSIFCYKFDKSGTYSINILAYDNHYANLTKIITIDSVTKADFSFFPCNNNLVNQSLCANSFYWDFGDGHTSYEALPLHQYADTGNYVVTLIAYSGVYSDTATQTIHIDVQGNPPATFTYNIIDGNIVQVHATSTLIGSQFNWSFGELGAYGTGRDSIHVYPDSNATYMLTLVESNNCGSVFTNDTVHIIKINHDALSIVPSPVYINEYADIFYNAYIDGDYIVNIYNLLGQNMFEGSFHFQSGLNEFKISTSSYTQGLYIMVLQSGNTYFKRKFLVVNKPQ